MGDLEGGGGEAVVTHVECFSIKGLLLSSSNLSGPQFPSCKMENM